MHSISNIDQLMVICIPLSDDPSGEWRHPIRSHRFKRHSGDIKSESSLSIQSGREWPPGFVPSRRDVVPNKIERLFTCRALIDCQPVFLGDTTTTFRFRREKNRICCKREEKLESTFLLRLHLPPSSFDHDLWRRVLCRPTLLITERDRHFN